MLQSTKENRVQAVEAESRTEFGRATEPAIVESYEYPDSQAVPVLGWEPMEESAANPEKPEGETGAAPADAVAAKPPEEFEELLAAEKQRSYDSGRARGLEEGRAEERARLAEILAAREAQYKSDLAKVVERFDAASERYLQEAEQEVVRLALAVAARILRREAQMDPLLLTGAVRVALGQLAPTTRIRLRVPQADVALWTEAIALLPKLSTKPEVIAGEGMRTGECVLETDLGSVDLGIRAQLAEIERGFFDRPGSHSGAQASAEAAGEEGAGA